MSASDISKLIFDINATDEKNNISTPIFSGSGKYVLYFVYMDTRASPKISDGSFSDYSIF